MFDDLLHQEPDRATLDALLARIDADPDGTADHIPAIRERFAAWEREGALSDAGTCAQHALAHWAPENLRDPAIEAACRAQDKNLHGKREAFAPLAFELSLRLILRAHGSAWVEENVRIPPQLLTWLRVAEGRWWSADAKDPYSLCLFGHSGIVSSTESQSSLFSTDRQRDPSEPAAPVVEPGPFDAIMAELSAMAPKSRDDRGTGGWIELGQWSDKHTISICCHEPGTWGEVHDWHDAHPWLNGHFHGYREAEDFLGYVRGLG